MPAVVSIQESYELTPGLFDPSVSRSRSSAMFHIDQPDTKIVLSPAANLLDGLICRTIIYH